MKIKVCGMKYEENIYDLNNLFPDFMGFIFYPKSKRFVGNISQNIFANISAKIKKVGVFVDEEDYEEIINLKNMYSLDYIQLHGNESPDFCRALEYHGLIVIKAFGIDENFDFSITKRYEGMVDYFLFDTKTTEFGGSGKSFDWKKLEDYSGNKKFFLSGGINDDNFEEIIKIEHPMFYGIDINSKFEIKPGFKNIDKIKKFITKIRENNVR